MCESGGCFFLFVLGARRAEHVGVELYVYRLDAEEYLTAAVAAEKPVFRGFRDWACSAKTLLQEGLANPRRDLVLWLAMSADCAHAVLAAVVVAHCLCSML